MQEFFTIGDICQCTGLTARTIRNYIRKGMLAGEKVEGIWRFSPEQYDAFMSDPNIKPSLEAKRNALVKDFMAVKGKKSSEMCVILDLPGAGGQEVADFFCRQLEPELRLSFESSAERYSRLILTGPPRSVLRALNRFYQEDGEA